MTKDNKIPLNVATEIVNVVHEFHYTQPIAIPTGQTGEFLRQFQRDIAQSIVLFLSGRAENIYPTEPGLFHPGFKSDGKSMIVPDSKRGPIPNLKGHASIPELIITQIDNYHVDKIPPGDFVKAVLENDLTSALSFADDDSFKSIRSIWNYCHRSLPPESWGSSELVESWLTLEGTGEDEDARDR